MITPDPHPDRPGQDAIHQVQVAGAHRRPTRNTDRRVLHVDAGALVGRANPPGPRRVG
jgi:hypothetical protein